MEEFFYIPLTKIEKEFVQATDFDQDELFEFSFLKYRNVINKSFKKTTGIVMLKTGKFKTEVFTPNDTELNIFFCLVDKNNYPSKSNALTIEKTLLKSLVERLSQSVLYSEGLFKDQIISIFSNFVTPSIKFLSVNIEKYYNYKDFDSNYIIFGPPGSGKTTLLRRITYDIIMNSMVSKNRIEKIPVYIQLREFNNYKYDFKTYIDNCIKNTFFDIDLYFKDTIVTSGKLFLLIDGADEIDYEKFYSFKKNLLEYKKQYPLITFIITSRPDKEYEDLSYFKKCIIQPLNDNQIKDLTYRKLASFNKWKEFITILNTTPEMQDILRNPLLLSISHFLFLHQAILPTNTGQLLKELVSILISKWDAVRNVERKLDDKSVSPIEITNTLGKISLALSEKKRINISLKELFDLFDDYESIEEFRKYLNFIEFSTGLIHISNDNLHFNHKSLQDFFCSNFLVESISNLNEKLFIDKNWENVLKMISGLSSDPNYIINSILNQKDKKESDKLLNWLSVYNESHLLTKNDIKQGFNQLESYFLNFEKANKINQKNISKHLNKILLRNISKSKGFHEILKIIYAIFQIRFTKYEYDFYGYLRNSKSTILKSLTSLKIKDSNLEVKIDDKNVQLLMQKESPQIN